MSSAIAATENNARKTDRLEVTRQNERRSERTSEEKTSCISCGKYIAASAFRWPSPEDIPSKIDPSINSSSEHERTRRRWKNVNSLACERGRERKSVTRIAATKWHNDRGHYYDVSDRLGGKRAFLSSLTSTTAHTDRFSIYPRNILPRAEERGRRRK